MIIIIIKEKNRKKTQQKIQACETIAAKIEVEISPRMNRVANTPASSNGFV